jgi:hypothetical protein
LKAIAMSSTLDPADQLLDEAVSRLKSLPVPDYPGPPRLDLPHPAREAPPPSPGRRIPRGGLLVVVCSVLVLAVTAVILPTPERTTAQNGLANVVQHPVQVRTVALDTRLRSLEQELDTISHRLDEIDDEILTQELLSDSQSLLAQYTTPEPETP